MSALDRFLVRPTVRPSLVVVCLGLSLALAIVAAAADAYWLFVLAIPLVFIGCRWGYGDSVQRALLRSAIALAALIVVPLVI
jgi:hypothetical protein